MDLAQGALQIVQHAPVEHVLNAKKGSIWMQVHALNV